ncbi:ribosomal-processing cysteine protease Prp [Hornefia butyriciproducens]|uniref:ribosomal-processing cysteine protease Prp n=1 Tax=Hornefia butyriciproducens TaxID=2652293 RepID=UPI0029FB87EB|nr:ribosomal-processing cysteine protease Prp [Hornefia butyriciproducens]MDD7020097.1 ribosomal-processing cysteine protease Prp [Hornefia butyriciproducens]MDY5463126.1 ribosomal-processing cysteine protease Prp [Hornefia butyriciproducens]
MIQITETRNRLTVFGHAGYAPPGEDIVCAAISALTQTLAASVEELTGTGIKCDLRRGNAVIEYEDLTEDAQLLVESFFIGAEGIAKAYPDCVRTVRMDRPGVEVVKSNG